MGYASETFNFISRFHPAKSGRVLDLGSQDLHVNDYSEVAELNAFIAGHSGRLLSADAPATYPTAEIWSRAGFDYRCVDVDDRPGTVRVDLQSLAFPSELRSTCDLVCNSGTTEHLANPVFGFAFMHYVCRPGGLMFHDVPLFGWGNHGLMNPTPKFWHRLAELNRYELLHAHVRHCEESSVGSGNFNDPGLAYIDGLGGIRNVSWMIRLMLRKREDHAFVPPFDAVLPQSSGKNEAEMVTGSMMPFLACGTYTAEEVADAVDSTMKALNKPYRLEALPRISRTIVHCATIGTLTLASKTARRIRQWANR